MRNWLRPIQIISLLVISILLLLPITQASNLNYGLTNGETSYNLYSPLTSNSKLTKGNIGFQPWYFYVDNLVNTANGNLFFSSQDIKIKSLGFEMVIERSYNSLRNNIDGPFGFGWTFNYNIHLFDNIDNVTIIDKDAATHIFTSVGGGNFSPPSGINAKLTKNSDATYTLRFKNGVRNEFDITGKLTNIIDKNGNKLTLTYTDGKVIKIEDDSGLFFTLNYNSNNRISSITDPLNRVIIYAYDATGNLITVTDALGQTTQYVYFDDHKLQRLVNRISGTVMFNYLDDKVQEIRKGIFNSSTNESRTFRAYFINYNENTVVFTNARGFKTVVQMNTNGNPIQLIDALGGVEKKEWDTNFNLIGSTDANGHKTIFIFDSLGNLIQKTDPLGHSIVRSWENIDSSTQFISLPLNLINKRGFTTYFDYDQNGNLINLTLPTGNSSLFSYDSKGLLTSATDFRGFTTVFSHDTHGNGISVTDALGNVTKAHRLIREV